jgi:hypothetical protein
MILRCYCTGSVPLPDQYLTCLAGDQQRDPARMWTGFHNYLERGSVGTGKKKHEFFYPLGAFDDA